MLAVLGRAVTHQAGPQAAGWQIRLERLQNKLFGRADEAQQVGAFSFSRLTVFDGRAGCDRVVCSAS